MKKIILFSIISFFLLVSSAFALGLTAGTVRILVGVGQTNSSTFGLINNGNETIAVKLRVEGDASEFITIPEALELAPKKLVQVVVTAIIPSDYDGFLGGNITGYIFAVQEGKPGQVQINVQARKAVNILIPEYGGKLPELKSTEEEQTGEITGFSPLSYVSSPLVMGGIAALVTFIVLFFVFRKYSIQVQRR